MDAESLRTINVPALIDAVNHLVDCSEQRVIECLLSSDVHAGNILKLLSQPINLYLTSARELLNHYLGTEDKFSQVPGQENKILLLKFLIYDDKIFVDMLNPYMKLLKASCTPIPVLLPSHKFTSNQLPYNQILSIAASSTTMSPPPSVAIKQYREKLQKLINMVSLNEFLEWYGRDLVLETQRWLARTLMNAAKTKQNSYDLPWDFSQDKMYVSTLPETLRFQLNVYLDLCTSQSDLSDPTLVDANDSISAPSSAPTTPTNAKKQPSFHDFMTPSSSSVVVQGDVQVAPSHSPTKLKKSRLLRVNALIVKAIARCFLLLAEEFKRALQLKHWADGKSAEEKSQNGNFLISLINDSFRTCTVHLDPLIDIEVSESAKNEVKSLVTSVTTAFHWVAEKSVTILVSLIYSDLEDVLVNFDEMWISGGKNTTKMITSTLKDYFVDIERIMEPHFYKSVVMHSAKACVLRYLYFFKDRSTVGALNEDQAQDMKNDIISVKTCFTSVLKRYVILIQIELIIIISH